MYSLILIINLPIRNQTIDSVGTARILDYICFLFLLLAMGLQNENKS